MESPPESGHGSHGEGLGRALSGGAGSGPVWLCGIVWRGLEGADDEAGEDGEG